SFPQTLFRSHPEIPPWPKFASIAQASPRESGWSAESTIARVVREVIGIGRAQRVADRGNHPATRYGQRPKRRQPLGERIGTLADPQRVAHADDTIARAQARQDPA